LLPPPFRSPVGPPFCVTTANGSTIFLHTVGLISSSPVKSPNLKPPACISSPLVLVSSCRFRARVPIMADQDRSPSPSRSSLPPPLHRHLRSAPQSSRRMSIMIPPTPPPWSSSGGQRSTTDPAFYTYPPRPNTSRELALPSPENQQQVLETTQGWQQQIGAPQPEVPFWDERFPHPQRIGHAESYTRADDSNWGGNFTSAHREQQPSDWRPVPLGQFEGHHRTC
jgi:hypothetical protein